MDKSTQAALTSMVFSREEEIQQLSFASLKENFLDTDAFLGAVKIQVEWLRMVLEGNPTLDNASFRNSLGMSTILRLLRFLPDVLQDEWLVSLHLVSSQKPAALEALSSCADWQSCLFQFLSELVERLSNIAIGSRTQSGGQNIAGTQDRIMQNQMQQYEKRLDVTLELYASLLGHRLREGGDQVRSNAAAEYQWDIFRPIVPTIVQKASVAVEHAASLQRVCLNGQEVFTLILSRVCANLSTLGIVPTYRLTNIAPGQGSLDGQISMLKRSARLVTDAILSNGSQGIAMPEAVGCWRCLRHFTAVAVAMVTRLGYVFKQIKHFLPCEIGSFPGFNCLLHCVDLA